MYKTPTVLNRPKSTLQPLWRYLSCERLVDLFNSEELFFTHLPKLSDGLEGTLTARTHDRLLKWSFQRYQDLSLARQEVATYEKHNLLKNSAPLPMTLIRPERPCLCLTYCDAVVSLGAISTSLVG